MRRFLFIFIVASSACTSDYSVELPNGYLLVRTMPGQFGVIHPPESRVLVGPSKYGARVARAGHVVVGNLDTEERKDGSPERYFIIDTAQHSIYKELSWAQYKQKLDELRVPPPVLVRPTRFTSFRDR